MNTPNYTPDMVARNVKQRGNGVIEIARYNEGHMKANMAWPWFLIVAGMTLYDIYFQQGMFNDIQWAISVDWALDRGWTRHIATITELGKEIPQNYYADYKAEMIAMHGDSFYWGWFYILFPLFWFCLLISPNWRPLRIDSKRRLIYFWGARASFTLHNTRYI
ncbi:hypothetical protein HMPREF1118_0825 [Haemophilus parainfluenzae HK262]|nr:hypothetical protein HMPREF1118_0825 [Haemophilus parainfluenzae HK262]